MIAAATAFLCFVLSIHDGDTVKVRCPIWPGVVVEDDLRIRGMDAPELDGQCRKEVAMAEEAKRLAQQHLREVELTNVSRDDKYGRLLSDVTVTINGQKVLWSAYLIGRGLARPYNGGARHPWCNS